MVDAQARLMENADKMDRPFLLIAAGDDRLSDLKVAKNFFDRFGGDDKTKTIYEGFFHEIFNEVERDQPISELVRWITRR
jgi:alpha-beta hydrolase superfamily lysophospholipase